MSLAEAMAGVRRLVACGNDELWYEGGGVAAGTMIKLAASDGDIDTSDNLMLVEAFGKAVILNGANKKVFDRARSKIATASVGTHPPDYGTVLTGGSSGAKMVVDYITALSGACTIYGYRTTTATFTTGEPVTGLDDDGNSVSFTMTAADEVAGPQWYDLTPFGNNASFGTLPTKLYLGALYLGRLYLAGDPDSPAQWYCSRQGNVFDYLYDQDDVQSAANGGDVEFGRLQDTIRALIPRDNDHLLFGCQNSIYAMLGDPRQGGSMKTVIRGVGVFGGRSWCFDENGVLYFLGTGGIYRILPGTFNVENMTEFSLPQLIHDEAADASTHRVTMEYDFRRHGILMSVTNLTTRVNSCYWYERRTGAFYLERYPEECAAFSMLYYDSAIPAQRDLLIGCADGYIRCPVDAATNDDIGGSDKAIDSYVTLGPFALGQAMGQDGVIGGVQGILAAGSGSDSANVTYYVYVADSPEQVVKKVESDDYAISGTVYAPGFQRGKKQRQTARGKFAAIRLRNNTAGQTWAFEEIEVEVQPAGRLA